MGIAHLAAGAEAPRKRRGGPQPRTVMRTKKGSITADSMRKQNGRKSKSGR